MASGAAFADNGAIAYAFPADGIEIDGRLDDWPAETPRLPITQMAGTPPSPGVDFQAYFRVAYDPAQRYLFVAVEVEDDSHVIVEGDDANWDNQDSHLLYLDIDHVPGRSAPVLFQSGEKYRRFTLADRREAPTQRPKSFDDATVEIARRGTTTVYEWRVKMGEDFRPGRSIGIDHLLHDADEDGGGSFLHWGPMMAKSSNAGRLGDLLPVKPDTPIGMARGQVAWAQPGDAALPERVTFTSTENPETWVQTGVDASGRFQFHLPAGEYRVSLPDTIAEPFGGWGDFQGRIEPLDASTTIRVEADQVANVNTIRVAAFRQPDFLIPDKGVLPDFDPERCAADVAELDHVTETFRRYFAIPGVSLALVKEGEIVYHRTFGTHNQLTGEPVAEGHPVRGRFHHEAGLCLRLHAPRRARFDRSRSAAARGAFVDIRQGAGGVTQQVDELIRRAPTHDASSRRASPVPMASTRASISTSVMGVESVAEQVLIMTNPASKRWSSSRARRCFVSASRNASR